MPVTIKSAGIMYKDPTTGEYAGIDAISDTDASRYKAEIEAAGRETLESIPSDYTELAGDVNELKSAVETAQTELVKKVNRSSVTADRTISGTGKVEFPDALDEPMSLELKLEPKRDLHGYDKPWVGGSGKNLCPTLSNMRTTVGITSVVNADGSVTCTGTATASSWVALSYQPVTIQAGMQYLLSGCPNGGGANSYRLDVRTGTEVLDPESPNVDAGNNLNGVAVNPTTTHEVYIAVRVANGYSFPSGGVTFYPILRLATETDSTYEPYSNICPITGYDAVEVVSTGDNLYDKSQVIYGKNWLNGNSGNRAVFVAKTEKGKTLHLRATQHGNTHRIVIVGTDKFGSNAVQSFNKNFQPGLSTVYYEVTADEYVICQFERYNDALNANVTQEDIDVWNIVLSYSEQRVLSLNLTSAAGGTVYGGTVTVNEDGSGELVVDKAIMEIPTITAFNGTSSTGMKYTRFTTSKAMRFGFNDIVRVQFEALKAVTYETRGEAWSGYLGDHNGVLIFASTDTTVEEYNQKIAGTHVVLIMRPETYETYPLTASQINSLLGYTQVITDTDGALTVGYKTDKYTKLEKFLAALPSDTATGDPAVFTDGADGLPMKKLTVDIQPKQDLHGYDKPWVGGSGVNQSPITVQSIKSASSDLQWNGNSAVSNGITFTILTDNDGNVTGINVDGTSTGTAVLSLYDISSLPLTIGTTYRMNGLWADGSSSTFKHDLIYGSSGVVGVDITKTTGTTFVLSQELGSSTRFRERLVVYSGQSISNQKFYPMIAVYNSSAIADYSPYSNICPISGWDEANVTRTGKNLWDGEWESGSINSTTGQNEVNSNYWRSTNYVPIFANREYYISYPSDLTNHNALRVRCYGADKSYVRVVSVTANGTVSFTANIHFIRFSPSVANFPNHDIQFELGSTATSYEPYTAKTLSVNLKDVSGSTVYGGTLTVNADGTGEVVVDRAVTTLADKTFGEKQSSILPAGGYISITGFTDWIDTSAVIKSDMLVGTTFADRGADGVISPATDASSLRSLVIFTTKTRDEAVAAYKNATVCYKLAAPQTYPLTATQLRTLLGNNTIWCDAGQVSMTYRQDTGIMIKNILNRLSALENPGT